MLLSGLVFFGLLVLIFTVVMVATRATAAERSIENRIERLRGSPEIHVGIDDETAQIIKPSRLSEVAWLDSVLQRCQGHHIQLLIAQAESSWTVSAVLGSAVLLGLLGYGIGYYELSNGVAAGLPAVLLAASPFLILRLQKRRRLAEFTRHLPEAIDLIARALRAGHSLAAAIEIVSEECPEPVRTEFREVYRQQNFGLPAREALVQLARRMPLPELGFVVTAMLLQRETGGNLVEVLERTGGVIRERLRIQGEIRIYSAQGRLTGWILSLLPVAMFFLLSLANHGYTRVLIEDSVGRKLIYAGLSLMMAGALAIRKIVNVKV